MSSRPPVLRAGQESHEQDLAGERRAVGPSGRPRWSTRRPRGSETVRVARWTRAHGHGAAFEQMGFRPGKQSALAAGLGEAGGGVLIALGLATPAAGAAATGTMIPATAVHAP